MSKVYERLKEKVERGRQGLNAGIPTRLKRLDQYTTGIQRAQYWLIGAETNVGKTAFARDQFIYEPWQHWLRSNRSFNINWLDFSLEMSAEENLASLISKDIFMDYGKVVTKEMLMSKGRDEEGKPKVLSEDYHQMFLSYEDRYEELEGMMEIFDEDITPTIYHQKLMKHAKKHGTFEHADAKWIGQAGEYTPNDPSSLHIVLFDTINLAEVEEKQNVKQSIDRVSRISVWFKNKCGFTFVILQQFNSEISGTERFKTNVTTPLLRDFEDSKRTTKDAEIVIGLYDPVRHDKETILFYNTALMKEWFRSAHLMKNRFGQNGVAVGMQFLGAVGMFCELPKWYDTFRVKPELYANYMKYQKNW